MPEQLTIEDMTFEVLIPRERIRFRLNNLADMINKEFVDDDNLLVLCVLSGAYMFTADLTRHMTVQHELDFIKISSYHGGTATSGQVTLEREPKNVEGRNVLIVEDIIDTSASIKYVEHYLREHKAKFVETCSLLYKTQKSSYIPYWNGFAIPDKFVVGYGLDYKGKYRNLPDVWAKVG